MGLGNNPPLNPTTPRGFPTPVGTNYLSDDVTRLATAITDIDTEFDSFAAATPTIQTITVPSYTFVDPTDSGKIFFFEGNTNNKKINLPTSSTATPGLYFWAINYTTSYIFTLSCTSPDTIDGNTTYVIPPGYAARVVNDQSSSSPGWRIVCFCQNSYPSSYTAEGGTSSAPGFTFSTDNSVGAYCSTSGTGGLAASGANALSWSDTGVTVGTPSGGFNGAGSLNVESLFVNNVAINPANTTFSTLTVTGNTSLEGTTTVAEIQGTELILYTGTPATPLGTLTADSSYLYWNGSPIGAAAGGGRTVLSTNLSLYVNSATGSDSNPGTSGSPFLTVNKAWSTLLESYDLNSYSATIYLEVSGTNYAYFSLQGIPVGFGSGSTITIQGNTTNPTQVTVAGSGTNDCVLVTGPSRISLQYMTLAATFVALEVRNGAEVDFNNIIFPNITANRAGSTHIKVQHKSMVTCGVATGSGTYTVTGGANYHINTYPGAIVRLELSSITFSGGGPMNFDDAFFAAQDAYLQITGPNLAALTSAQFIQTTSPTGNPAIIKNGGWLDTGGNSGASLPGNGSISNTGGYLT